MFHHAFILNDNNEYAHVFIIDKFTFHMIMKREKKKKEKN
jgi:hypothetical protein